MYKLGYNYEIQQKDLLEYRFIQKYNDMHP